MSNFLKWTGHHRAIGLMFALSMLGCVMVLAAEPFEWVDIMHPVGPWALLTGFAVAIPRFVVLCLFVRGPSAMNPVLT